MTRLIVAIALAGACVTAAACGGAAHSGTSSTGAIASSTPAPVQLSGIDATLQQTWQSYTRTFIRGDGRVQDPRSNDDTTSEGQSYALLRAMWMNDRSTFDSVWTWTEQHLWQPQLGRFAWLANASGSVQDTSSASDADQDIALALLFAAQRWHDSSYRSAALRTLGSIWTNDVASVGSAPYVVAGNWAANGDPSGAVLDPSYFAPYAYRIFARADSSHDWMALVSSSYSALKLCSQAPLRGGGGSGLPPNWCVLRKDGGGVASFSQKSDGDDYGYDAFRVMWRVALDVLWNGSQDASTYLQSQQFLRSQWQEHQGLAPVYTHAGAAAASYDDPTVYGGDVGAFLGDSTAVTAIVKQKLLASLQESGGQQYFGQSDNYYEQNWVWFGLALATGRLTNLAAGA